MSRQAEAPILALPVSEERDHIQGPPTALVTLVEYGDFECPHCGMAHPIVKQIQEEFGDDLRFVFRHFPLSQVHPHAERAAEAAGAQGLFWPMHDTIFENQGALDDEDLIEYAQELDLDVLVFRRDLISGAFKPRVREDFQSGVRSGVNGTPTFFINGRRHNAPWDLESLSAAILEELREHPVGHRRGPGRSRR